ncbi:UNVERIFIED_CONTAM: hypothetical protein PYX00_005149 [Menopon gallinae]|uniref:ATR-interacting protein n=1 Tax=Menopon gallinae TaxID=328185 RepID=A0AAW2HQU8_9NEOP
MNRTNTTPRRSMGRPQPKRPKLDFTTKPISHTSPSKSKDCVNGSVVVNNNPLNADITNEKGVNIASLPEWDDDEEFSSDMLEKVCMFADFSQAMANSQPSVKEVDGIQKHALKRTISERNVNERESDALDELTRLKVENKKLLENIKTKEGEVQILRSQLKQNQDAKQAEAFNNIKIMEEMQTSYREKIEAAQKEYDAAKTELQFKELELKSLSERCKQLEATTTKIKLVEPQSAQLDSKSSITPGKKLKDAEADFSNFTNEEPLTFNCPVQTVHEGQKFGRLLCPEYFTFAEEPSVISLYKFSKGCGFHVSSLDFDKREKYKWSGLPTQSVFVKDSYSLISELFLQENFTQKIARELMTQLLKGSIGILKYQRDLLTFLEHLQEKNSEFDDSDHSLLENEEEVFSITVKDLLDGKKINKEECGIESRRILAMLVSVVLSSRSSLKLLVENIDFMYLLKDLVVSIGNLRKPIRYTGILAGITLLLNEFLKYAELANDVVRLLCEIIGEVIFARPKLDVLTLVVEALANSGNHESFVHALCRRGSVESCALYMDSKLHQAMFFTKDACPLKLLCTQIMGLSCIPVNRSMKWSVTFSVVKWLNRMMDTSFSRKIKWLPTTSENEDKCFDVMECVVYLLNSCLKDYLSNFNHRNESTELLSIVGDGCLLFRRVLKSDQRLLHENSHYVRFATLLRNLNAPAGLQLHQSQAIGWILELESDLKNQEGCGKPNASYFSDKVILDALKINDDLTIY